MNCIAILKTRCGCERFVRVPRFEREVRIRIFPDLTVCAISAGARAPAETGTIRERIFDYHGKRGPETAEYVERWSA